jgi:dTDP-4-dehydrorhamnose reductase
VPELNRIGRPRILITGGSGLLALNWACQVRDRWDVVLGTHRRTVSLAGVASQPVDLTDAASFGRSLDSLRPDLVVHTAGLTDVDRCEADPAQALAGNAEPARTVAEAAATRSIRLVHISTDHLFTGVRPLVDENEAPQPMNQYAASKLRAEEWVRSAHPSALVVRTNFFGWGHATRRSFSDWILDNIRAGKTLSLFDDVFFTPILAGRVATECHALVERGASGVFNVCGDERISKYQFAIRLVAAFGSGDELFKRSSIAGAGLKAPRPNDMSLDHAKARGALGAAPRSLEDDFSELQRQEAAGQRDELLKAVHG